MELDKERNEDPQLEMKQKERTGNMQQDHNKISTDITVATNRIKDLETRREILYSSIKDLLKDKRKVDKQKMLLEEEISGRNMTDEMAKQKYKNEERKMRIKQDKTIVNLRLRGDLLDKKNADEENKSKAVLDEKLKLEQELMDLNEDLQVLTDKRAANREDTIKMRVRNSQLDSQSKMLEMEQASLTD